MGHLRRHGHARDVHQRLGLQPRHRWLGGPQRHGYELHFQHRFGLRPGPRLVRGRRREPEWRVRVHPVRVGVMRRCSECCRHLRANATPDVGAHGAAIDDANGGPDVAPYLAADARSRLGAYAAPHVRTHDDPDVRADGRAHDAAEPSADADADARAVDLARADDLRLRVRDRGALSDDQRVAGRRARGRPRPGLRRPGVWEKAEKSRGARPRRRGAAQREQVRRAAQQHDGGCLRGRAADHLPVGPDRRLGTQGPALRVRRRPRAAVRPAHLHGPRPLRERRARQRHGQPHGRLSGCRGAPRRLPSTWIGSRRRRRGRACFRRPTSVRGRRSRRVGHTAARLARRRGPGLTAPADARRRRKDPTRRRRAALGSARGATTA